MQVVTHTEKNIHPLFTEFETVYSLTSEKYNSANTLISPTISQIFMPLIRLFRDYGDAGYHVKLREYHADILEVPTTPKRTVIVCLSGGKDSLATALHYKEHNYQVYLYHLKGINKTYKDEDRAAQNLSEMLDLPLCIEEIQLQGNQAWVEHPMKNMILANMALQWGIREGIGTRIAFGNFITSSLDTDPFDVCGGDCKEMWEVYNNIISTIIPNFKIQTPLDSFKDTIEILSHHGEYLQYVQSCIGPYRYREYLKKKNEEKYGITLLPHRCGSCWKCCLEYIIFCDRGVLCYNKEYHQHCWNILQKTLKTETGVYHSMEDTKQHYLL